MRRGGDGLSRGLLGTSVGVIRADDDAKLLVLHRWDRGGPGDDVIVVANLANRSIEDLRVGLPAAGRWRVRFNSDSATYGPDFGGHEAFDTETDDRAADGHPQSGLVSVGPYTVVLLSQDP